MHETFWPKKPVFGTPPKTAILGDFQGFGRIRTKPCLAIIRQSIRGLSSEKDDGDPPDHQIFMVRSKKITDFLAQEQVPSRGAASTRQEQYILDPSAYPDKEKVLEKVLESLERTPGDPQGPPRAEPWGAPGGPLGAP